MNEESTNIGEPSYPKRNWFFSGHSFQWFLFGVACLVTLIALFYAEEDWRGWHALNKFQREWQAKGEKFDLASVIPPPVPDDQNFALTPIVFTSYGQMLTRDGKGIPDKDRDTNFVNRLKMEIVHNYEESPKDGNWQTAKMSDLKAWRDYYRALAATTNEFPVAAQPQSPAQDVLLALSKYDPAIEELRQASQLPYSRFPLNYDNEDPAAILLPHLAVLKQCSLALQLRAIAELQNGQSEKALDDVKLSWRLADSIRTEPFLISQLVRIAILQIALQPVYEGLAEHKWSDAQLVALDAVFSQLDFLADYESAMRGELGLEDGEIKFLRNSHKHRLQLISDVSNMIDNNSAMNTFQVTFQVFTMAFGPSGWFDQNELRIDRFFSQWYLPAVNVQDKIVSPTTVRKSDAAFNLEFKHRSPENTLEFILLPQLGVAVKKFAYAQSSTDLARTAIALERYRLAHGGFPGSLDALAPQFIAQVPDDIIGGEPLHYRLDDGQFVLYSVGWNGTDDGGIASLNGTYGNVDISKGDWVWRYPQK